MNCFDNCRHCIYAVFLAVMVSCSYLDSVSTSQEEVTFKAVLLSSSSVRTTYSDVVTNGIERIDWEEGDLIRIVSPQANGGYSDYVVSDVFNYDGTSSYAHIRNAQANGLTWGSGKHDFYAIYPSPGTPCPQGRLMSDAGLSIEGSHVVATIPEVQAEVGNAPDMEYAYMAAYTSVDHPEDDIVLRFLPMFNAFTLFFEYNRPMPLTVYSVALSSSESVLSGSFAVDIGLQTNLVPYSISPDQCFSVSREELITDGSGINNIISAPVNLTLSAGDSFTATLFAVPGNLSGLTLHVFTDYGEKRLALQYRDGSSIVFSSFSKALIKGISIPNSPVISFSLSFESPSGGPSTELLTPWLFDSQELILNPLS